MNKHSSYSVAKKLAGQLNAHELILLIELGGKLYKSRPLPLDFGDGTAAIVFHAMEECGEVFSDTDSAKEYAAKESFQPEQLERLNELIDKV